MGRAILVGVSLVACFVFMSAPSFAQASKQLEGRAKKVATSQADSWKQVDQINRETDNTKSRYQEGKQANTQPQQKTGYNVKKTKVGTGSAYKKHLSKKQQKSAPKQKPLPRK
jgi:hypothetical protein